MQRAPFYEALDAVLRPLESAGQDAASVAAAAQRAAELAIPPEARRCFNTIAARFAKALTPQAKEQAAAAALEALDALRAPDYADAFLSRSVAVLPGAGTKRAEALAKRGLRRVGDLLFHLPTRYDDRRRVSRIGELQVGLRATFAGEVLHAELVRLRGRRPMLQAVVGDGSGTIQLKWFRGGEALQGRMKPGVRLRVTGEVRRYRFEKELIHPEMDVLAEGEPVAGAGWVPVYAAIEGVPPRTFRGLVARAVDSAADLAPDLLPDALAESRGLPPLSRALREIHQPPPNADAEALQQRATPAHERLVLEELFLLELGLALRRATRAAEPGIAIAPAPNAVQSAVQHFPFQLTGAQQRAWREIRGDLAQSHPMSRLLQGDVGSGKTAIAALAAVACCAAGHQAALMAPTELLAEQHIQTLRQLLSGAPQMRMALLTASVPRAESRALRERLAGGEALLAVGTHALLQGSLAFRRLALVIVDEQHRFGVLQRAALAAANPDGRTPHVLVMTATPIPRSLALTLYGDLDLSVMDELPPGRQPAQTLLLRSGEGRRVMDLLRDALDRGEQAFVVYPLVEESENSDLRAATQQAEVIRRALPDIGVELMHGRQPASERAQVMERFRRAESRVLVATTVVEVGVDVPNATLMVVEHAERFGLAQLHQLRGRVGRGARAGVCVLVARGGGEDSEARLRAMLETTDGFRIADADLRIRGPGDFLGTRQHGKLPDLRFADLVRDARLVAVARDAARETVHSDPGLASQPTLARAVQTRWGDRISLFGVG